MTDEMNAIPLPLEEELALVDPAEPEVRRTEAEVQPIVPPGEESEGGQESVDIVSVVDDLLEPPR